MRTLDSVMWQSLAASTVILTFLCSLVLYLLQPLCRDWVWKTLGRDKRRLAELLKEELALLQRTAETVDEHSGTLAFLKSSIERQGEELRMLPRMVISLEQMGRSFEAMTTTLREIHDEVIEHGKKFERWDGFMEGQAGEWKGGTRRQNKRRKNDPEPT